MNIKDIARLADVSASTVSKIINGKHDDISPETRERVLQIVKEYNYSPYTNSVAANASKTFLIGILLKDKIKNRDMLDAIVCQAHDNGYGVIICISRDAEEELKNISMLLAHRVDGVLWQRILLGDSSTEEYFSKKNIPFFTINHELSPSKENLCMDFQRAGYLITEKLVNAKHEKIACLTADGGEDMDSFINGYKQCLHENNISVNNAYICNENTKKLDWLMLTCTGFVCFNTDAAFSLMHHAIQKNYRIPRDFSVVGLACDERSYYKNLSVLPLPYSAFGRYCCRVLVAAMEDKKMEEDFCEPMSINGTVSVDLPLALRNQRIIVVGALNVDTLLNVNVLPKAGETNPTKSCAVIPGGRGVNQAIGAAKLGAEVCLIGRRGKDFHGNILMDALMEHNVDVSAVKTDTDAGTGQAYIYIQDNGISSIVVNEGANLNLTPKDVEAASASFRNASFCLLQTELRRDTVECAAQIAKQHGAKVLLKPAAMHPITEISDSLLRNIDVFLPNLEELKYLCPEELTIEEKAQYFLDRGVGTVIITLADKGCYLRNKKRSEYFTAADVKTVDTTGAADAFAAALVVYLNEGRDISTAIRYANCAAGLSITRQGVSQALVDKGTLESFVSKAG